MSHPVAGLSRSVRTGAQTLPGPAGAMLLHRLVAFAAVVALATRFTIWNELTVGYLGAGLLLPVTFTAARRYAGAQLVLWAGLIAAVGGIVLSELSSYNHRRSSAGLLADVIEMLGAVCGVMLVLWARRYLSIATIGVAFGLGLLLSVDPSSTNFAASPWRFGFSTAVTVIVLGLVASGRRSRLQLIAILVLLGVSALAGGRSTTAILLITLVVVAWRTLPRPVHKRGSAVRVVAGLAILAAVVYNLGQALVLEGLLGEAAQARTLLQIEDSGSLLVGGRPELAATWALMEERPFGLGVGTFANWADLTAARNGLASINYDPNNNYVERYMFGTGVELHSVFGDLWVRFGILGLGFVLVVAVVGIRGLARRLAGFGAVTGMLVFAAAKTFWNIPFSPWATSIPLLVLFLGLVMAEKSSPGSTRTPVAAQ